MEPEIMQPTAIDEVLPVVEDAEAIGDQAAAQLTCNIEEGEE